MLKGYDYNHSYKKRRFASVYTQEHKLIQDFAIAPDKENIRFEYGSKREAINARGALAKYVKETKKQLNVLQREEFVFVVKRDEKTDEQG